MLVLFKLLSTTR